MNATWLRGCGTALVTPFNADGSLDEVALGELVDHQIEEGIDFLVPAGTTGESPTLRRGEQRRAVEIVVARAREHSRRRVPVIAGAGGNDTARAIELARDIACAGADGLLSVTPCYNRPTQEGLYDHYAAIAHAVPLPLVLYNVPTRTAVNLLPETVLRLARLPTIVGIKEANSDLRQLTEIVVRAPAGFRVLTGDDASILPGIALGACGVVSVLSNLIPREMTRFTRHCLEGRFAEAREQLPALLELIGVCGLETNPIPIKTALALVGRINERVRAPLGRMSEPNRGRLARTLEALLPRVEGITPGPRSREPLFERRAQAVGAQIGLVETAADE